MSNYGSPFKNRDSFERMELRLPDIFSSPSKTRNIRSAQVKRKVVSSKSPKRRYRHDSRYDNDDDDDNIVVKPNTYDSSDSEGEEEDSVYYYDEDSDRKLRRDRKKLIGNMQKEWSNELERIHFNKEYYKMKTPHLLKYLKRIRLSQKFHENSSKLVDSTIEELFDTLFHGFAQGTNDESMGTTSTGRKSLLKGKKGRLFEISEFGFLVKSKKGPMVEKFKNSFRQTLIKFHRNYNIFKKFEKGNLARRKKQKAREMEMEENRVEEHRRTGIRPEKTTISKTARELCEEEMSFVQLFYQIKSDLAKEREIVHALEKRLGSEIVERRNQDFEIVCLREQLKKRDVMIDKLKKKCYKELMKMKTHFCRNQYDENEKLKKRINAYRELMKNPLPYTLFTPDKDFPKNNPDSGSQQTSNQKKKKKNKKKRKKKTKPTSELKNFLNQQDQDQDQKKKKIEKVETEEVDFFKDSTSEESDSEEDESELERKNRLKSSFAPIYIFQPLSIFSWGNAVKTEVSKLLEKQKSGYDLLIHQIKKNYEQKEQREFQKYLEMVNRINEILIASSASTSIANNDIDNNNNNNKKFSDNNNNNSNSNSSVSGFVSRIDTDDLINKKYESSKHITDQFQEQSNIIANLKHQNFELQNEMNRIREKEFMSAKETIHNMIQGEKLKKKNEFLKDQLRKKLKGIQELCDRLEDFKLITRNEFDHYMTHDTHDQNTLEQTSIDQTRNVNFLISKKKALDKVHDENKKFLRLLDRVKGIKQLEIDSQRFNTYSKDVKDKIERKWEFIKKTLYNYVLAI